MITLLTEFDLDQYQLVLTWCNKSFGTTAAGKWDFCIYKVDAVTPTMRMIKFDFADHKCATLFQLAWGHLGLFSSHDALEMHLLMERVRASDERMACLYGHKIDVSGLLAQHSRKL